MNTLLLPTLARCLQADPQWSRVLGRAQRLRNEAPGLSAQVHAAFGLPAADAVPWATVLAHDEGVEVGQHSWLAMEALSLRVAPNGVYVVASNDFGQTHAEMAALWVSIEAHLREEQLILFAGRHHRAYLQLPTDISDPATAAAEDLLGAELTDCFPVERHWRRRLNEFQIIWSQHQVNQVRGARAQLPINSPWFGRAATWSAPPAHRPRGVLSPDPLLRALARWAGVALMEQPESASGGGLLDLRDRTDQALTLLTGRSIAGAQLNFACGARFSYSRWQHLRIWRAALAAQD